jgi:hypothetical protein
MYITNFVCTYKRFEDIEDDEVNSDMLYQAQFLQVFGLTEYNPNAVCAGLELIKAKANEIAELKALILQHPYGNGSRNGNGNDNENDNEPELLDMLLPLMFAYPLLDAFHLCLIDAFQSGSISAENRNNLLREYDNMGQCG